MLTILNLLSDSFIISGVLLMSLIFLPILFALFMLILFIIMMVLFSPFLMAIAVGIFIYHLYK
jgi:hypothetical protein